MAKRLTKHDEFGNSDIIGVDSIILKLHLEAEATLPKAKEGVKLW